MSRTFLASLMLAASAARANERQLRAGLLSRVIFLSVHTVPADPTGE